MSDAITIHPLAAAVAFVLLLLGVLSVRLMPRIQSEHGIEVRAFSYLTAVMMFAIFGPLVLLGWEHLWMGPVFHLSGLAIGVAHGLMTGRRKVRAPAR